MPIDMATFSTILFLLIFHFTSTTISATPVPPATACNATLYPAFCSSILPSQGSRNLSEYAAFAVAKSLSTTFASLDTIYNFFASDRPLPAAINDCRYLFHLNADLLSTTNATFNVDDPTDTIHTLLSSVVTDKQTCLDGLYILNDTDVKKELYDTLYNATEMLYSVTLSLFVQAKVANGKSHPKPILTPPSPRRLLFHDVEVSGDDLPLTIMRRESREIFETRSGRRLLQAPGSAVVSKVVVVSQDGTGDFTTITAAVDSAPEHTDGSSYFLIYVTAGVYVEYLTIAQNKKYLMMVGDGINRTVITGNRNMVDGWKPFNSASFTVVSEGFVAINMTFQNTAGAIKEQAVAVRNSAQMSTFYKCSFDGYQDTLYTHSGKQFYKECNVYGTVDFIFGNAPVVFQNCNIYPRLPSPGQFNAITAQGRTEPHQNGGISLLHCNITPTPDLAAAPYGSVRTYLGRPWKEYSRTVVMLSFLDSFIDPAGWVQWSGDFALSTLDYAEFNNSGPGSNTSWRVTWPGYHVISKTEAVSFTVSKFIQGDLWLPKTGVPYVGGLL